MRYNISMGNQTNYQRYSKQLDKDFKKVRSLLTKCLKKEGFSFKDEWFPHGYLFDGDHKMWHFELVECPDWMFGVWMDEKSDFSDDDDANKWYELDFFAQHKFYVDKFKPSASSLKVVEEIYKEELPTKDGMKYELENLIKLPKYIKEQPYLAWYRDVHFASFDLEYVSPEDAKKDFEESEKERLTAERLQAELDAKETEWMKKAFEEAGYKYKILTHENMYPRHTAVIEEEGTKPGCYDVFEDEEWEDFNKIYESYRKKGYFLWQTFNRGVIITDDLRKIGKKDV